MEERIGEGRRARRGDKTKDKRQKKQERQKLRR
jgi:hypothetical protein